MDMLNIPLFVAFAAGLISFLSPCVLPIIPGFLAYLAGETSASAGTSSGRTKIFLNSLFFVIGFALVFAILGVLLQTVFVFTGRAVQTWLSRVGGLIIIFFGLYLTGFFKIGFFECEHKFKVPLRTRSRYLTSFLFGFAFAAGWTPCVGPILGGILGLAASAPGQAFWLLLAYAIGLGVPFLLVGLFVAQSSKFIARYAAVAVYVTPVFGVILIILGILVFTQELPLVANLGFVNSFLLRQ